MLRLTGGSAYPHEQHFGSDGNLIPASKGMTLRDDFAKEALRGLIGSQRASCWGPAEYATCAYSIADAMIAQRGAK